MGFKKALIVTDKPMVSLGIIKKVQDVLKENKITNQVFDGTQPNPTVKNVSDGVAIAKKEKCDFIMSVGGGSVHDCAKGVALVMTNGGSIKDYEGVNKSKKPQMPLIAVNTTAGTAAEMTVFCIITDTDRKVKMAIVDKNINPMISCNDPLLMVSMPKGLTAATGMDAFTHAIEAYVSTMANPITDGCAAQAIRLI